MLWTEQKVQDDIKQAEAMGAAETALSPELEALGEKFRQVS